MRRPRCSSTTATSVGTVSHDADDDAGTHTAEVEDSHDDDATDDSGHHSGGDSDVLVYFNNDPGGAAVTDAVVFAEAVRRTGRTPTRVPTADEASGRAWAPREAPQAGTP